jgi:hypothetical protein
LIAFFTSEPVFGISIYNDPSNLRPKVLHTGNAVKRILAPAVCLLILSLGLGGLAGCGGSSSSETTQAPPASTISSFAATPATITAGGSSSLTAVFANGTGIITPGNLAATSGTGVSVSPTTTTTYTITVTGSSGAAVTQTVTVTVLSAPTITSFMASPATITAGGSSILTAVYANGTGVIMPGNLPAPSGTPVSVSPTATTTYTLTVTNAAGTAATQTATITVVPAPSITSFAASPATITTGSSATLTGVFTGGTGVITPGNIAATSGAAVTANPTATTTYTLTVTNAAGTAVTQTATVTVTTPPTITSFIANPATIGAGSSSLLTAVFANGTGVITPGNLPVTSGSSVSVTPAATTTYTLTVTPTTGTAIAQTVTVTVGPQPSITSFSASPTNILVGTAVSLTAVFANGTGVITPGNLPITSGIPVSVNPTTTTTYTLTVTPSAGNAITSTAAVTVQNSVTVNLASKGPAISDQIIGMNLAEWYDPTNPAIQTAFAATGVTAVRWPGGSNSDLYNWETNTECGGYAVPNANFTTFVNNFVKPANVDLALTADYGTGTNCTGPGQPTEAAAWAANALTLGVTVSHMTVGNEEYGSWEVDNHTSKHNGATYAAAVAGSTGYYALIKAASPSTLVGVSVEPNYAPWDQDVLTGAPFDFVEYHYYPQNPGNENDTFLIKTAPQQFTTYINTIKSELTKWGNNPNAPIYVGEMGSVSSNPGKQSWSITQGLYAGQLLGEMMNDGIKRATWWIGFGNCTTGGTENNSASLYGWQDFGAYNVFSDGPSDSGCPGAGPIGTMSPTAVAYQLFSKVAVTGESVLTTLVGGDTNDLRGYAATNNGGTALVLFNLNETTSEPVTVTLSGQTSATTATVITYDKAIYDLSGSPTGTFPDPNGTNTWDGPITTPISSPTLPLTLTLAPWSMNVVIIK